MISQVTVGSYAVWKAGFDDPIKYYNTYEEAEKEAKQLAGETALKIYVVEVLASVVRSSEVIVTKKESETVEKITNGLENIDPYKHGCRFKFKPTSPYFGSVISEVATRIANLVNVTYTPQNGGLAKVVTLTLTEFILNVEYGEPSKS